jgi:hypothetical protein
VRKKQAPIFPHLEISAIQKFKKNVKSKSFLKKKSYGFPLLRHQKLKTRFARKRKKVARKPRPNFSTSGNLATQKSKKCKNEKFFERKIVWISSVKDAIFKNPICMETKKVRAKTRPNFSTSGNSCHYFPPFKNAKKCKM